MEKQTQLLIASLNLPGCLKDRILCRVSPPSPSTPKSGEEKQQQTASATPSSSPPSFVLYLPTVLLRKRHNPAFALACRLANHYNVPVLVLVTILDDKHLVNRAPLSSSPIAMTSRRLAFTLEALQESCCPEWESHGAGVAVRVHGPGCRTPHHLSLVHSAMAVVSDEPFVEPYRTYARSIARTCRAASVPFWTVDGSTSVPPNSKLARIVGTTTTTEGDVSFAGAPSKAWRWEKQTDSVRKQHVYGAYRDKALDAPDLACKLPPDFFLHKPSDERIEEPSDTAVETSALYADTTTENISNNVDDDSNSNSNSEYQPQLQRLRRIVPSKWKDKEAPSPGQRPWTVSELCQIEDCKAWSLGWKGADASVPPCRQTHGSRTAAKRRWRSFVESGLKDYAKRRNGIVNPHAVSRVSCYLNLGILSIFDVLHDVWQAKSIRGYATGCSKYLEEVVKWREGSYVHAFANPNYHTVDVLPSWALLYLEKVNKNAGPDKSGIGYDYKQLESASTKDETWNAMQEYLIETGELHNNARMTWGKTVVQWQAPRVSPDEILWQLCCLNDRFALDGLSPPSYGGLLWCLGWQDKPAPGKKVSEKWAHRYRTGASGFLRAKENLYDGSPIHSRTAAGSMGSIKNAPDAAVGIGKRTALPLTHSRSPPRMPKKARQDHDNDTTKSSDSKSILSYFGPIRKIG